MVLVPCSPELFDRRFRVMAAGNTVRAQCDVRHAKSASQPGTPGGVPITARHDHRHRCTRACWTRAARKPPRRCRRRRRHHEGQGHKCRRSGEDRATPPGTTGIRQPLLDAPPGWRPTDLVDAGFGRTATGPSGCRRSAPPQRARPRGARRLSKCATGRGAGDVGAADGNGHDQQRSASSHACAATGLVSRSLVSAATAAVPLARSCSALRVASRHCRPTPPRSASSAVSHSGLAAVARANRPIPPRPPPNTAGIPRRGRLLQRRQDRRGQRRTETQPNHQPMHNPLQLSCLNTATMPNNG